MQSEKYILVSDLVRQMQVSDLVRQMQVGDLVRQMKVRGLVRQAQGETTNKVRHRSGKHIPHLSNVHT